MLLFIISFPLVIKHIFLYRALYCFVGNQEANQRSGKFVCFLCQSDSGTKILLLSKSDRYFELCALASQLSLF